MKETKKKFVKVDYGHGQWRVYACKERKSFQVAFILLVLEAHGRRGKAYISLEELKEFRGQAERVHHGREWDGKMFDGAKGTLCNPLFGTPEQARQLAPVTGCTVNLEGLSNFVLTGLDPHDYGMFTDDQLEFLDEVPKECIKDPMPGATGWCTPEQAEHDRLLMEDIRRGR